MKVCVYDCHFLLTSITFEPHLKISYLKTNLMPQELCLVVNLKKSTFSNSNISKLCDQYFFISEKLLIFLILAFAEIQIFFDDLLSLFVIIVFISISILLILLVIIATICKW